MLRWLMLLISIAAFTMAWRATEPATLGWSLLVGFIAIVWSFLGFASARVASVASGQHFREQSLLVSSRSKLTPAGPATKQQASGRASPTDPAEPG